MTRWTILSAVASIAVLLAGPAQAQRSDGEGQRERPTLEDMQKRRQDARQRLFEELKLDDGQIHLVDSLLVGLDDQRMELMEEMRASFDDRDAIRDIRQQMRALQSSTNAQIVALLSEEQKQLWEAVQAKAAERRSERWGDRRGGDAGGGRSGGDSRM